MSDHQDGRTDQQPGSPIARIDTITAQSSGPRSRHSLTRALESSIRAALHLARVESARVQLTLRGNPGTSRGAEIIEGTIREIRVASDGRERAVVAISADADRIVPIDQFVKVARAE